jgi:hypothetical protein
MLTRPAWIELNQEQTRRVQFIWDDTRALMDFRGDAGDVLRASMKMSLRARMVLCVGLYEWIIWRFEGLHIRIEPLQIAQVAWCAAVDPRYMRFFELTREEWRGPIEGPLWCAATWLQPAMSQGHLFPRGVYDALSFLTRMGLHVLPNVDRFQAWLQVVLDRLVQMYPLTPESPFEDLFDRRASQRLGPLIGRNVLDPDEEPDAQRGVSFLAQTLREARDTGNPFLSSPDDLKEVGFTDVPYIIPTP